ncbi:MAG TPA: energy transducer TonB [Chitinophagales bacterium]|nr:energy transducer TonB [Chitinophagales bacterium]
MFATEFENEERRFKNRKTATAGFVTAAVHGLILLALILTILRTPIPPFEDNAGGMSVNYGTDETGSGDIQPFTYNPGPTEATATSQPTAAAPAESQPEKMLTDENSEVDVAAPKTDDEPKPKVNKKAVFKPKKKNTHTEETPAKPAVAETPAPQPPKPDQRALFSKGAYGAPNKSAGDGTGGPQGDQGKVNGDPNSRNYLGDGNGNGSGPGNGDLNGGYRLTGRKRIGEVKPVACSNTGRVVIKIKVDRDGKVTQADFNPLQSTVFEDCNKNNAISAALRTRFNPNPNAPEIQEGTITYIYKVN